MIKKLGILLVAGFMILATNPHVALAEKKFVTITVTENNNNYGLYADVLAEPNQNQVATLTGAGQLLVPYSTKLKNLKLRLFVRGDNGQLLQTREFTPFDKDRTITISAGGEITEQ